MRHALLSQSAPGKHRDRESAPTRKPVNIAAGRARLQGKRFPTTRDLLILEILKILKILIQTDEDGQAQCLSTPYREERLQSAPTGDLSARLQTAPTRCIETGRSLLLGIYHRRGLKPRLEMNAAARMLLQICFIFSARG